MLCAASLMRADPAEFRFAILGDRTGEAQAGVWEQVWRETAAEKPAFVLTTGDIIEGLHDAVAEEQWREVERGLQAYRRFPLYLTPGNHDIWSEASEELFRRHAGHAPHYSFDYAQAHFTILDNSRSDELPADELDFLEQDLKAHAAQSVKFIVSHRPSWLIYVAMQNPNFRLHQLARQYGVRYVIAGHVHQMMHAELQSVTYLSMPSAGGHLRNSGRYEDGWFFGHTLAEVRGTEVAFRIEELKAPHGQGRVSKPADWTLLGLAHRAAGGSRSAGIPAR
jgi:UDP-2,3-diacylglucosamine pyrophosphatase LpxH